MRYPITRRPRAIPLSLALLFCTIASRSLNAQVYVNSVNDEGVEAPCLGVLIGVMIEKKCVDLMAKSGFVRKADLGYSGLTLGDSAPLDGLITAVDPNSPAAAAGLQPGDAILAVDGKPSAPTPAQIVEQQAFGARGEPVHLKVRSAGTEKEIDFQRAPANPPGLPKAGMLLSVRPLIDWRMHYIPCVSIAGPTGLPTLAYCQHRYEKDGYIRASDLGATGFTLDPARTDAAIVATVEPNSPAALAGLAPGDQVLSVNAQPLTGSSGVNARIALFGHPGDKRVLTIKTGAQQKTIDLVLALQPKQ